MCWKVKRRGRDSNPRWRFTPQTHLAGGRLQPLGHLSMPRCTSRTGTTHPQYDTASSGHLRWAAPSLPAPRDVRQPPTRDCRRRPRADGARDRARRAGARHPADVAPHPHALVRQPAGDDRPRPARHLSARLAPAHRELADPAVAGADRLGLGLLHRHLARRLPARLELGRLLPALPADDRDRPDRARGRRRGRRAQRLRADAAGGDGRPLHAGPGAAVRGSRLAGGRLPDALAVRIRLRARLHGGAVPGAGRLDLRLRRPRAPGVGRRAWACLPASAASPVSPSCCRSPTSPGAAAASPGRSPPPRRRSDSPCSPPSCSGTSATRWR